MICYHIQLFSLPQMVLAHHFTFQNYSKSFPVLPDLEITYIKQSDIIIETGGAIERVHAGEILILPHKKQAVLKTDGTITHSHSTVRIKCDYAIERVFSNTESADEHSLILPVRIPAGPLADKIADSLTQIISLYNSKQPCCELDCCGMFISLLAEISSHFQQNFNALQFEDPHPYQEMMSRKIKMFIAKHIGQPLSLNELSDAFGKTPNYLNSCFKNVNNITLKQYINREKINKVIQMTCIEKMSLKEAGETVGIFDPNYLSRLFKKQTGLSYRQYISNYWKNTRSLVDKNMLSHIP